LGGEGVKKKGVESQYIHHFHQNRRDNDDEYSTGSETEKGNQTESKIKDNRE
jgi:hypothetical protein